MPTIFGAAAGALALWWLVGTARRAAAGGQAERAARASFSPDQLPPIGFGAWRRGHGDAAAGMAGPRDVTGRGNPAAPASDDLTGLTTLAGSLVRQRRRRRRR